VSATGRGADRRPDDFYSTPGWVTRAILPFLPLTGDVLDPCAGDGAILREISKHTRARNLDIEPRGIELDGGRAAACEAEHACKHEDALYTGWGEPSLIITNPPYSLALAFVVRALKVITPQGGTVAMLLRLAWLASLERAKFHERYPADVYVLPRRPSFTGDGKSDSTDYGWFVWGPGRGGRWQILSVEPRLPPPIPALPPGERNERRLSP
jgi:hypothetical protein